MEGVWCGGGGERGLFDRGGLVKGLGGVSGGGSGVGEEGIERVAEVVWDMWLTEWVSYSSVGTAADLGYINLVSRLLRFNST